MMNKIVNTTLNTTAALLTLSQLAGAQEREVPGSDYMNRMFDRDEEERPRPAAEPADATGEVVVEERVPAREEESFYRTRFESPLHSVRGEDPILNYLTIDGKVRGSYLLSGMLTLGSQEGSLDAGAAAGEIWVSPFNDHQVQRLSLGFGFNAMYGETSNGKVGIDPLTMSQLDASLLLGYNFDLGDGNEVDARAYLRGEWSEFDDRVNLDNGLGGGEGSMQIGMRLGVGTDLGFGDLRFFADLFGTHRNMRGEYHGEDIIGNVAEGAFGRDGISGMVELDLMSELGISPRIYGSWEQYQFEGIEKGTAHMMKFACPFQAYVASNEGDLVRRALIMPYAGFRGGSIEQMSTGDGMDDLRGHGFGGAGLLVEVEGIQGLLDLRYDDERGVQLALSVGGRFGGYQE